MLDEVKMLVGQLDNHTFQAFPSALLTTDLPTFSEHLKARSTEISSVISQLFSKSMATSPEVSELQGRIAQLLAAEKGHITELEKTRLERDEYIDRLEKASLRYMLAEKRLDRARSATVAKLEKQAVFGGSNAQGSGLGGNEGSGSGQDESANIKPESGDDLFEAEEARKEAVAASAKQKEQLEVLEAENKKLLTQVTTLNNRLSRLTDEDYSRTDLFKHLKSQHEDVIKRINHLEATNVQLREEAEKLQAERTAFRLQIENESQAAVAEKETQLVHAENDLARIRTARDELIADVSMRKATQNQEKASVEQVKELANAKEARIKVLESQIERLGAQIGQSNGVASPEPILEDLTVDELQSKYANLERQYKMLSQELQSMGTAYTKASTLASQKINNLSALEEKVTRLGAEKSKADQKYFAAMKSKEARDQEVRTLRAQNSKSSDIVSQLKDSEASVRALNINLEKQVAELKESLIIMTNQQRTCQQNVNERNITLEGFKSQVEELKKFLLGKDSSASTIASAHRKAEVEIEQLKVRLEETQKSLESWKTKGLGNQSDEYEMLRVSFAYRKPPLSYMADHESPDPSHLHRLPDKIQGHRHQNLRARLLQRLRRGTSAVAVEEMSQLQQAVWYQRPFACNALVLVLAVSALVRT